MPQVPRVVSGWVFCAAAACVGCGGNNASPIRPEQPPEPEGAKDLIRARWESGREVSSQLRAHLSDLVLTGLRPGAVAEYRRSAAAGFASIPREGVDRRLNEFLDLVQQAERDTADVYDQCGSDSKCERLTPDEFGIGVGKGRYSVGLYFKVRESCPATDRINNSVVEWRRKVQEAEKEIIDHIDKTHGVRLTPW